MSKIILLLSKVMHLVALVFKYLGLLVVGVCGFNLVCMLLLALSGDDMAFRHSSLSRSLSDDFGMDVNAWQALLITSCPVVIVGLLLYWGGRSAAKKQSHVSANKPRKKEET